MTPPAFNRQIIVDHFKRFKYLGLRTDLWRAEFVRRLEKPKVDWEHEGAEIWRINIEVIDEVENNKTT